MHPYVIEYIKLVFILVALYCFALLTITFVDKARYDREMRKVKYRQAPHGSADEIVRGLHTKVKNLKDNFKCLWAVLTIVYGVRIIHYFYRLF